MAFELAVTPGQQVHFESTNAGREAVRLRREGLTDAEIAEHMGVSAFRVKSMMRAELVRYITPDVVDLRALEAAKLDAMERAIAKKVENGNLPAIGAALKIMERRSRLLALDSKDVAVEAQEAKILDVQVWKAAEEAFKQTTEEVEIPNGDSSTEDVAEDVAVSTSSTSVDQ